MGKELNKFRFDVDFQWSILKYTIKDKYGYKAILLYKHEYFELDDQQVIAHALERFFKRKKRVPASSSVLNQELNKLFKTRDYAQALLEPDRERIKKKVKSLYKSTLKDGDDILEQIKKFASYVELRNTLENIDLEDFDNYDNYSKKIQKAVNLGMEMDDKKGSFIVSSAKTRMMNRRIVDDVIPTPFNQINKLTNAGGYTKGSIIVLVDRPKKGKTLTMVNFAKAYMSRKGKRGSNKKVIYFDLENGEESIGSRIDQLIINKSKSEVLSGEYDQQLEKQYRKYKRLGGEIFVVRMRNGANTNDFQKVMDDVYSEYGIKFDIGVVDYMGIMGATSGAKDDLARISDAYLDVKNWAVDNNLDHVITGHHVTREAYSWRGAIYETKFLAKCIDIERHVDALYGIQQNEEEEAAGIFRLEVMEQRDGYTSGRALFHVNLKTQKLREFTKEEIEKYKEMGITESPDKLKERKEKQKKARDL